MNNVIDHPGVFDGTREQLVSWLRELEYSVIQAKAYAPRARVRYYDKMSGKLLGHWECGYAGLWHRVKLR